MPNIPGNRSPKLYQTKDLSEVNSMVKSGFELKKIEADSQEGWTYTLVPENKANS